MSPEQKKAWMIGGAMALVLVVVLAFLVFRSGGPKKAPADASLTVVSVPNDLTLTLDGTQINQNGTTMVTAGQHTLVASRSGFAEQTQEFSIASKGSTSLEFYLDPNSAEGRRWYAEHPDQQAEADGKKSREYDDISRRKAEKYPMITKLPAVGPEFRIDYGTSKAHPNDPEAVGIYVKIGAPSGRTNALNWMSVNGFDPKDYELIFSTIKPGKWTYH